MNKDKLHYFMPFITKVLYDLAVYLCLPEQYIYGIEYGKVFNSGKLLFGWLFFALISFLTIRIVNKSSDECATLLLTILLYLYFIPVSSAYYINDLTLLFLLLSSCFWIILVYLLLMKFRVGGRNKFGNTYKNTTRNNALIDSSVLMQNKLFYIICFSIDIACIIYAYLYNGFSLTLNITDIYDARADFVGSTNLLTSFLFNFGGNVVIGISMYYGLKYKKYLLTIIGSFAQLGIFSIARQKSNLLLIGIVVLVYFVEKFHVMSYIKRILSMGVTCLIAMSLIEILLFKTSWLFNLFIRRLMYYPAWLNGLYYRFFSEHKLLLFTQDAIFVNRLGINRYDSSVLQLINLAYFKGYVPAPNAGLFAEAYMHLGFFGAMLFPIIEVIILKWIFNALRQYDKGVQIYFVIIIVLALISIPITSGVFVITYIMLIPMTFFVARVQLMRR